MRHLHHSTTMNPKSTTPDRALIRLDPYMFERELNALLSEGYHVVIGSMVFVPFKPDMPRSVVCACVLRKEPDGTANKAD